MHDTRGQIHNFTLTSFAFVLQIIFKLLHFWLVAPAKRTLYRSLWGLPSGVICRRCWSVGTSQSPLASRLPRARKDIVSLSTFTTPVLLLDKPYLLTD